MQFNSSLNRQESILALTQVTKGARALAVRDSNVSKWCLRASKGLGRKRKKVVENNYLLKFHTWSPFGFLSGLVPRPLARYKSNCSTPFRYFEHSCNG